MVTMRKAAMAVALGAVVLAGVARAQNSRSYWGYSQQIGSTSYINLYGSEGSFSGQMWRLGDTIYYDFRTPDGTTISGSSYRLGTLLFHNISVRESPLSTLRRSDRTNSPKWPW